MWEVPPGTYGTVLLYLVLVERYDGLVFRENIEADQTTVLVPNLSKLYNG